jgi:hypothetical protein
MVGEKYDSNVKEPLSKLADPVVQRVLKSGKPPRLNLSLPSAVGEPSPVAF